MSAPDLDRAREALQATPPDLHGSATVSRATEKWDLSHFPVERIKAARENDYIYDRFGIANADDAALAFSIQDVGVQEPLLISSDDVLLSGHRRLAASRHLGLTTVPVRVSEVMFESLDKQARIELLRRHNQQRDKSPGERIRERLVDIKPEAAYRKLLAHRVRAWTMPGASKVNVDLGDVKKRARITTIQFLEAVQRVIEENRPYWPLTDRRVHYLLLNDPPLRHDKKPSSIYVNDKGSYTALTNLLIRARLTGDVPIAAIEDTTRPIQLGGGFSNVEEFVQQETEDFLERYSRNLMQGQPNHIEILLEKNALRSVIESVAREYCIPMTTGRGFSSLSPRYDMWRRYRQSGKSTLVLLMLTDFDPDGEQIAASFARSMRDDFYIQHIRPVKVALTAEDVRDNDLPSDMDAKPSSPNYKKFLAKHRTTKAVELDAAPVPLLQQKLREAIHSVMDVQEYNAQIEQEKQDAASVEAYRQVVFEAIKGAAPTFELGGAS